MERGEEIVFADEYGSWMIPSDEKTFVQAYVTSLAAVETPDGFTMAALPLIQRDSYQSFATRAYTSAMRATVASRSASMRASNSARSSVLSVVRRARSSCIRRYNVAVKYSSG